MFVPLSEYYNIKKHLMMQAMSGRTLRKKIKITTSIIVFQFHTLSTDNTIADSFN